MTDIDFDELDREVNKLFKENQQSQDSPQDNFSDDSSTKDTQESQGEVEAASDDSPQNLAQEFSQDDSSDVSQTEENNTELQEETKTTPARSRGRFMDVMHPSSDMTNESDSNGSDQLTSTPDRKTLEPLSEGGDEPSRDIHESDDKDNHHPVSHTDMPDPIDFHEERTSSDEKETGEDQTEQTPEEQKELPENQSLPDNNSLGSLFNETEVEKRPLGRFSQSEEPTVTISKVNGEKITDEIEKVSETEENTVPASSSNEEDEQIILPPELEKDLVAIEAGESPDDIPSNTVEEGKKEETPPAPIPEQKENKEVSPSAALLASGSIPQQYKIALKEKVSREGDGVALFDSSHYDKSPTKATSKKKSGHKALLQWIFIVIGLFLLGSTIGAALFVFVSNQ